MEKLIEDQVPNAYDMLEISEFTLTRESDVIVTAEPRAHSKKKMNLIYYSSDVINMFRKLELEKHLDNFLILAEISCITQLEKTISYKKEVLSFSDDQRKKILKVGYTFSKKKTDQLQDKSKALSCHYPIEYVPVDLRFPLYRDIDAYFHKITDFSKITDKPLNRIMTYNYTSSIENRKDICFVDNPKNLEVLSDRHQF